jgi:hypothetical protein
MATTTQTTRETLVKKADAYRKMAEQAATASDRNVLLRKARNYYEDAELTGLARWCERHMG